MSGWGGYDWILKKKQALVCSDFLSVSLFDHVHVLGPVSETQFALGVDEADGRPKR